MFLYYALGAALEAHIPVILCTSDVYFTLFDEDGVKELSLLEMPWELPIPQHALFLVDSTEDVQSPPGLFLHPFCRGLVVQATSTGSPRWIERLASAQCWIMELWSYNEIQTLQ